jgi:hypothetical protein
MSVINGINFAYKNNVVARTTVDISLTYVALPIIDDIQLQYGDRVLIMNQTNDIDNGIYVALAYSFNRDTDANTAFSFVNGAIVRVVEGTLHANTEWFISPIAAVDYPTASKIFVTSPFIGSGGGSVGAANGLSLVSSNIELGGTLTKNTVIDAVKNTLTIISAAGSILYINGDTGNTGIGTSTSTAKVHIKGTDSTSANHSLKIEDSNSNILYNVRNDGNMGFNTGTLTHKYNFLLGNSQYFSITGGIDAGLLIDSVAYPYQDFRTSGVVDYFIKGLGSGNIMFGADSYTYRNKNANSNIFIIDYNAGNPYLYSAGSVGIGTTPTSAKLHILQNTVGTGQKGISVNFATIGETFYIDDNGLAKYYGGGFTIAGSNGALNLVSNGGVNPGVGFKYNNGSNDCGTLYGSGNSMFLSAAAFGIGGANFNPQARLHVTGASNTVADYALKIDNSIENILSIRDDHFVDVNVNTNYARILSLNSTVSSPTFMVYGNTGEALRVEGYYGRVFMGGAATTFNDAATLNIGGYGLSRYIYFGLNGNQASFTDADGTGIIFTGKQKTLATTEFKLVSDEGLLFGNNHTTAYFRRNVDIGGSGTGDALSRLYLVGETSDATKNAIKVTNSSAVTLLSIRNDGYTKINGLNIGKGVNQVASNTVFGVDALSVATGIENTAIGYQALRDNTIGTVNTAVGNNALLLNISGIQNTAIGYNSGRSATTANNNTSVGFYTLFNNTGDNNTAIGDRAMYGNTSGAQNTAIGRFALYTNLIGQHNVAIGHNALNLNISSGSVSIGSGAAANSTGSNLVTIGRDTLAELTTGVQNTVIGWNSGRGITTGSYNTVIGANVTGLSSSLSNSIIVGNSNGVVSLYTNSNGDTMIGAGVTDAAARLHVKGLDNGTTNYALKIHNLAGTNLLSIRNDGALFTGSLQGASGTFTSNDGKTITVTNGLITSIV